MNEPEMNPHHSADHSSPGMNQKFCQCPFCGSTDLVAGSWYIDDEDVDAIECEECKAGAPASVWNERASPWRYPGRGDPMPEDDQEVLAVVAPNATNPSSLTHTIHIHNWLKSAIAADWTVVRWMPIPEATP